MMKFSHKVLFSCLLLLSAVTTAAPGRPPTPVNVVPALFTEIFPTAWVSGSVISNNDAEIAAQVDGRLIYVAQVGDKVKEGDVIAKIDDTVIALQVKELEASVNSAKRSYEFLIGEVKRKRGLTKKNLSAKTDLDETISNRDIAKARLAEESARLAQTRQLLVYTKILAPFNGVVTTRLSKLGEVVSNATKVVKLVETANLEVTAQVPLTSFNFLHQGHALDVKSPLGRLNAKIRAVVPVADARSHLMELRLTLEDSHWPVGLDVRVAVPNGKTEKRMVVPRDAIVLRRDGNAVFKINDQNKAERVPVELGIASGSLIAVEGDLAEGDKVVIRGSERLQPGQTVAIRDNNDTLVSL
jgi:RND family efflux transporter MFP subunit